ncbi:AAA ATPase domain protein [Kordia sp. SMS9]|uniref:ATP-binding protein n=1 Tax=Kordia sp. SMS9 TaxID=2282170 RepID=UPI000E0D4D62|nr:ATP-binding protein [Kordia sp. SMS9]AXG71511.1 AAA ATPase domain protein [Kordia sp. SMS9]
MSSSNLSKYSAKIKDVYIELKGYEFFHSPFYQDEDHTDSANSNNRFIGRRKILERIQSILKNTKIKSGAYLITGFRGMGKTSVIREAVFKHNNKHKLESSDLKSFWINLVIFKKVLFVFIYSLFLFSLIFGGFLILLQLHMVFLMLLLLIFAIRFIFRKDYTNNMKPKIKESKIIKSLWNLFKVLFIISITFIVCLDAYLSEFNIFSSIKSFFTYGKDSTTIKDIMTSYELVNHFSEVSYVKLMIGILLSLLLLNLFFFINDLGVQLIKKYRIKKNNEKIINHYKIFEINLSQDSLNEIDILRRITIDVRDYWQKNKNNFNTRNFDRRIFFLGSLILKLINNKNNINEEANFDRVLLKLNILLNRISGKVTTQKEVGSGRGITTKANSFTTLKIPYSSYKSRNEVSYPVASAKEVEDSLIEIFKDIDTMRKNSQLDIKQFIFIIDELDKIEQQSTVSIEEKESSNPKFDYDSLNNNRYRQRQEAVASLLANLKGFLNVVRVKFFFIGGREMYDAYLADIADRDSFYSSIFNDVIYVKSFFKDSSKSEYGKGGITQMTEKYLCNLILNNLITKDYENEEKVDNKDQNIKDPNLKKLYKYLHFKKSDNKNFLIKTYEENTEKLKDVDENTKKQIAKIVSILQNFIVYLAYRSNGTPKKLTTLVEKIIVTKSNEDIEEPSFRQENLVVLQDHKKVGCKEPKRDRLFLKFSYNFQYEIGLTASLYRPYIISNSRHLKSLGDKLLYSSSFIIDHIFKFHPFGFSWRNLELIPEVVLVNREPNLRKFIDDLMRFYSSNYLEDAISGIFDYKFRGIVRRELIYLSKTSDLSSAAFNFTLDESLFTKRHYKKRLIELENKYDKYIPIHDDNQFVHAISFTQTILGDLHFYDKEYDEAIIYYSESIQSLRFPTAVTKGQITRHQFLIWLRNQLKLGLTLEKIRAFDSAFSLYKTLILDTQRYLEKMVVNEENFQLDVSDDHRKMNLISMPFIALLGVIEKSRVDGVTYDSLFENRQDFLQMIESKSLISLKENTGKELFSKKINSNKNKLKNIPSIYSYRKNYLKSDYYNNVGSILFYKNCQYPNFFRSEIRKYHLEAFLTKNKEDNIILKQQYKIYNKDIIQSPHITKRPYDFYPSLTSFNYYWNSIYFLTLNHQSRIIKKIKKRKNIISESDNLQSKVSLQENLLAMSAGYLLPECIDMISGKRMYYLATVIAKLGDCILSSLKKEEFKIPKEEFKILDNDINNTEIEKREINIKKFIELVDDNLFTTQTVFHVYKLAAALFKRSGHNYYYGVHLIKMLYLIKDLVEINKEHEKNEIDETKVNTDVSKKNKTSGSEIVKNDDYLSRIEKFLNIQIEDQNFRSIEEVAETVFMVTSWNNEIANRPQILKYREILEIFENKDVGRNILYNNLSNTSNNREVLILVEEIKMKLNSTNIKNTKIEFQKGQKEKEQKGQKNTEKNYTKFLKDFKLSKGLISPYSSMNNRYLRMLELKYRTERCYFIMKNILGLEDFFDMEMDFSENSKLTNQKSLQEHTKSNLAFILDSNESTILIKDIIEFLTKEALFCLQELIKMFKLYDPGYVIGYSYIALAHDRMADWCNVYENYKNIIKKYDSLDNNESKSSVKEDEVDQSAENSKKSDKHGNHNSKPLEQTKKTDQLVGNFENFKKELMIILGSEILSYLEPKTHYEIANQYYYKVVQMHSDSKAYNDKLYEIYILEDDYNDISTHHALASERMRVNTGSIRKKLNRIKKKLEKHKSRVYQYKSYFPGIIDSNENEASIERNINNELIKSYKDFFNSDIAVNTSEKKNNA